MSKEEKEDKAENHNIDEMPKETIVSQIESHLSAKGITVQKDKDFKEPEDWEDDEEIDVQTIEEALEEIDNFVKGKTEVKIVPVKEDEEEYIDVIVGNKRRWIIVKAEKKSEEPEKEDACSCSKGDE